MQFVILEKRQKLFSHKLRDRHIASQVLQQDDPQYLRYTHAYGVRVVFPDHGGGISRPPVCTTCNQQSITGLCPLHTLFDIYVSLLSERSGWRMPPTDRIALYKGAKYDVPSMIPECLLRGVIESGFRSGLVSMLALLPNALGLRLATYFVILRPRFMKIFVMQYSYIYFPVVSLLIIPLLPISCPFPGSRHCFGLRGFAQSAGEGRRT